MLVSIYPAAGGIVELHQVSEAKSEWLGVDENGRGQPSLGSQLQFYRCIDSLYPTMVY